MGGTAVPSVRTRVLEWGQATGEQLERDPPDPSRPSVGPGAVRARAPVAARRRPAEGGRRALRGPRARFERRAVVIVASISCIYGLGAPIDYGAVTVRLTKGERTRRDTVLRHLVDIQYERNDQSFVRGKFRVRGDTLEVHPAYEDL